MASHDSPGIPKTWSGGGTGKVVLGDASEVAFEFEQSFLTWTESGREVTEAMSRGRHETTPVLIETTDGNIEGSVDMLITTWSASSNMSVYEALSGTGLAAAVDPVGAGDAHSYKLVMTFVTPKTGESQTITFGFCRTSSIAFDLNEGKVQGSFSFIDYENRPTKS